MAGPIVRLRSWSYQMAGPTDTPGLGGGADHCDYRALRLVVSLIGTGCRGRLGGISLHLPRLHQRDGMARDRARDLVSPRNPPCTDLSKHLRRALDRRGRCRNAGPAARSPACPAMRARATGATDSRHGAGREQPDAYHAQKVGCPRSWNSSASPDQVGPGQWGDRRQRRNLTGLARRTRRAIATLHACTARVGGSAASSAWIGELCIPPRVDSIRWRRPPCRSVRWAMSFSVGLCRGRWRRWPHASHQFGSTRRCAAGDSATGSIVELRRFLMMPRANVASCLTSSDLATYSTRQVTAHRARPAPTGVGIARVNRSPFRDGGFRRGEFAMRPTSSRTSISSNRVWPDRNGQRVTFART